MDVGREDGDAPCEIELRGGFQQQHPEGIGLFAAGASGDPQPDFTPVALFPEKFRYDCGGECVEGGFIPEEGRHPDEQVAEQGLHRLRVVTKVPGITFDVGMLFKPDAAHDAPCDGGRFVVAKVEPAMALQQREDGLQRVGGRASGGGGGRQAGMFERKWRARYEGGEYVRHFVWSGKHGSPAGRGCCFGHAIESRAFGELDENQTSGGGDGLQPRRPVGAGAGKDDPCGVLSMPCGEGGEEGVDGHGGAVVI